MIEYKCNKGKVSIDACGDLTELGADIGTMFYVIADKIKDKKALEYLGAAIYSSWLDIFGGIGNITSKEMIGQAWKNNPEMIEQLLKDVWEVIENGKD